LSSDRRSFTTLPVEHRVPLVATDADAEAARPVRFDRPLVEVPGWADPRVTRQIGEAIRDARLQGKAQGYADGLARAMREARQRERAEAAERATREEATRRALTQRTQEMLASVAQAGRALTAEVLPAWDALVDTLLDGALGLAAAALGRELSAVDAAALEAARAALRQMPATRAEVRLHVNPADLDLFAGATAPDGDAEENPLAGLQVEPDPRVPAGTAVARTALQSLPVDVQAALRAAEEVLRG
jgi:flagellar biosynthesis/type III secretory pathway protein FliH